MSQCKEYSRTKIVFWPFQMQPQKVELEVIFCLGHLFLFSVPPPLLLIPHLPPFYFPPHHPLGSGNRDGIAFLNSNKYGTKIFFSDWKEENAFEIRYSRKCWEWGSKNDFLIPFLKDSWKKENKNLKEIVFLNSCSCYLKLLFLSTNYF